MSSMLKVTPKKIAEKSSEHQQDVLKKIDNVVMSAPCSRKMEIFDTRQAAVSCRERVWFRNCSSEYSCTDHQPNIPEQAT
jgi:hypothetical protein